MRYRHTQVGYATLTALLSGLALLGATLWTVAEPFVIGISLLSAVALGLCCALFASLTVEVEGHRLRFYFGPGFWRREVDLTEVESAEVVRVLPLTGYGILVTPWLARFNVSGTRAVELRVRDGRRLRIGTDEPERLRAALEGPTTPAA